MQDSTIYLPISQEAYIGIQNKNKQIPDIGHTFLSIKKRFSWREEVKKIYHRAKIVDFGYSTSCGEWFDYTECAISKGIPENIYTDYF